MKATLMERERERFVRKQRETTGAPGRELVSSADYQNKSAVVCTQTHTLHDPGLTHLQSREVQSNKSFKPTEICWDFLCHIKYDVKQMSP